MKKKVLILYGGISKERAISLETGRQVAKELKKKYSIKLCEPKDLDFFLSFENIPATNSNLLSNLADNLCVYPINELGPPPIKPIRILLLLFKVSFLSKSNLPKAILDFFFIN